MKLLVGSFAASMGEEAEDEGIATAFLPPLTASDGMLDLEFSLLLSFDSLIFDRYSVERLAVYDNPTARRITHSLRMLEDAGLLTLTDYRAALGPALKRLEQAVEVQTRDFSVWIPHIKRQFEEYDKILPSIKSCFGTVLSEWDDHTFGVARYLQTTTGKVNGPDARAIRDLIESTHTRRRQTKENQMIRDVIKPVVANVYSNLFLAQELDAIPYGWGTLNGFYDQALVLAIRNIAPAEAEIQQCRQFFELAFQEFKPRTVGAWIALLKDPRIRELREHIKVAINTRDNIDQQYAQRALASLQQSESRLKRYKTHSARVGECSQLVAGTFGSILGALAGPEMSIVGGVLGGVTPYLAQEGIDALVERKMLREHSWLYFTSLERSVLVEHST